MPQIEVLAWKCERCGYVWTGRNGGARNNGQKPATCARCRSRYWDVSRPRGFRLLRYKCTHCGHKWVARIVLPGVCPKCHNPYWNRRQGDRKPNCVKSVQRGRPQGSETQVVNAYDGRAGGVRGKFGEDAYQTWGKLGGTPILLLTGPSTQVVLECIHHWILDTTSYGRCKKCGAEKQFPESVPSPDFNRGQL